MSQPTIQDLQDRIDSLQFAIHQEIIARSQLADDLKALQAIHEDVLRNHKDTLGAAAQQINGLTEQVNKLIIEMDKQIQFQHWFFEELVRPDDAPPVPFAPEPLSSITTLKSVK